MAGLCWGVHDIIVRFVTQRIDIYTAVCTVFLGSIIILLDLIWAMDASLDIQKNALLLSGLYGVYLCCRFCGVLQSIRTWFCADSYANYRHIPNFFNNLVCFAGRACKLQSNSYSFGRYSGGGFCRYYGKWSWWATRQVTSYLMVGCGMHGVFSLLCCGPDGSLLRQLVILNLIMLSRAFIALLIVGISTINFND